MHANQKQMLDIANIVFVQILFLCKMQVSKYSVQEEEDTAHDRLFTLENSNALLTQLYFCSTFRS